MTKKYTLSFIAPVFIALALLFGVGPGHSLLSAQPMHATEKETMAQCQSICPPILNEEQITARVEHDDAEPNPFPLQSLGSSQYTSILYAVVLSALTLSFLRRRPPDLAALYATYRL